MAYIDKDRVSLKDLVRIKRKEYKHLKHTYCYMLRSDVHFTFAGFQHLHIEGGGSRRGEKSAYSRLLLMEYAPLVISSSRFMKEDKPKMKNGKVAVHYELYGKVGKNNANVVVTIRRLGEGNLHFYGIRYK